MIHKKHEIPIIDHYDIDAGNALIDIVGSLIMFGSQELDLLPSAACKRVRRSFECSPRVVRHVAGSRPKMTSKASVLKEVLAMVFK